MTTASAINTQITTTYLGYDADGKRTLNVEGLRGWLRTQMAAAITASGVTNPAYATGNIDANIAPLLATLSAVFSDTNWATKAGWPLSTSGAQAEVAADRSAALAQAITAVNLAAAKVTTDYDTLNTQLTDRIKNDLFAAAIAPNLPTPVDRILDTRFYMTTLVTAWGEESAPSPVSALITADQNDTVTVARPTALSNAALVSERQLTGWRIYRSNGGSQTTAFQLVKDLTLAELTYEDSKKGAELGEVLPTTTWLEPPVKATSTGTPLYLRGLTGMANGIMAGFYDNTVCFCHPYVPYAWPVEYQLTTKYPIVGMSSFGQTLFVGTRGSPYLISGADSASMSAQELPGNQACVSARSIVAMENGGIYASPDGICVVDLSGVKVITQTLFTREDWKRINPSSIIGAVHHGVYYFLYNNRETTAISHAALSEVNDNTERSLKLLYAGLKTLIWEGNELFAKAVYNAKQLQYGFTDDQFAFFGSEQRFTAAQIAAWKNNLEVAHVVGEWKTEVVRSSGCYALDFVTGKLVEVSVQGTAFHTDLITDTLYVVDGANIVALFDDQSARRPGVYGTGIIKLDKPAPMAWLQVDGEFRNPVTVRWYADGVLRHIATVSSLSPVRLPAGLYLEHEIEVESQERVTAVTLAGSTMELQAA